MPKFSLGDQVRVVNYGHWIMAHKDSVIAQSFPKIAKDVYDIKPELVGRIGIIVEIGHDMESFVLDGIPEKVAWYHINQLEPYKSEKDETN